MSFTFSVTLISGQAVVTTRYLPVQIAGGTTLVSGAVGWISVDQYGNLKLASGTQVSLSGLQVITQSGVWVIADVEVIVSSGLNVIVQSGAPVSLQSGLQVNIGSGVGVIISGQTVVGASGLYVQISGQGILISGQTVAVASGLFVQMSGQGALISGQTVVGASGLYVQISGQGVTVASGLFVSQAVTSLSGQWVITQSGVQVYQPTASLSGQYVVISGQGVTLGSGVAVVASGLAVILQSGLAVVVPTTVSGNVFVINTSGTQFPSSPGIRHLVKLLNSSVVFIAGDASVNSGTGYLLAGDPMTDLGAQIKVTVNNLNKLYGIAQTSSQATFLSFNF